MNEIPEKKTLTPNTSQREHLGLAPGKGEVKQHDTSLFEICDGHNTRTWLRASDARSIDHGTARWVGLGDPGHG